MKLIIKKIALIHQVLPLYPTFAKSHFCKKHLKSKYMSNIMNIDSVQQYNDYFGIDT